MSDDLRNLALEFLRHRKRPAAPERLQPRRFRLQRLRGGTALEQVGDEACGIDAKQQLAGFHGLTLTHRKRLDHAAIERLHDLELRARNHPRLAAGDLVEFGKGSPHQQQDDDHAGSPQQAARTQRFLLQARPVGFAQPIAGVRAVAAGGAIEHRVEHRTAGRRLALLCHRARSGEQRTLHLRQHQPALPMRP